MASLSESLPPELAAAIEDLRHIREAVDTARANHPLRLVAGPLLRYATLMGAVVAVYGVSAQLLLVAEATPFGVSADAIVWPAGALLLLVAVLAKLAVIDVASRRVGYDIVAVVRATYTPVYLQIMLPGALTLLLGSLALHRLGGDVLIPAFASAGFGALVVAVSGAVSLPEWSFFGALLFLLGALWMFALADLPFLGLAVCWGGALLAGGLVLRRRFPAISG